MTQPSAPDGASDPAPSPWRGRRARQRDHACKRAAVIRAAARAFDARGYHNTSIDDIAAALEVTKPTIYYYVANKEQLLLECFLAGLEQIRAALRAAADSRAPAREQLAAVMRHYARAIAGEYGWCMVRAADQDLSPESSARIRALKSEIDQGLRRLLRDGMRDGSIAHCDARMTAFAIAGALNWIAHWFRDNRGMSAVEVAEAFVDIFKRGLLPRPAEAGRARRC
ncbi:MAG: TetR family transcriptional regulator [Gammaproteobacteria bacterium]|nr:TetR family transcriptional regulator [Gammaproteobacteria bacterium]